MVRFRCVVTGLVAVGASAVLVSAVAAGPEPESESESAPAPAPTSVSASAPVPPTATELRALFDAWGTRDGPANRKHVGPVAMRDVVETLARMTGVAGAREVTMQEAQGGTPFVGVVCELHEDPEWDEHGYSGLDTYRLYALFAPFGDRGILAVHGADEHPMVLTSSDGVFHNDDENDRMTAPVDLRDDGVWSNQWDTYVTINGTQAATDRTFVSPDLSGESQGLSVSFQTEREGYAVTPDEPQSHAVDGRVLLGQFTVAEATEVTGAVNVLTRDGLSVIDLEFFGGGPPHTIGACCLDGVRCRMVNESVCETIGGVFLGTEVECAQQIVDTPCHPGAVAQHCVRVVSECPELEGASPGEDPCEPAFLFVDGWVSMQNEPGVPSTFHDFGVFGQAIPAGFFGEGSRPFHDLVPLSSVPIGDEWGEADTILKRSADPFHRCELPSPEEVAVDVEVLWLSLKATDPIMVNFTSGPPQFWNMDVNLSIARPTPGTLRAIKTTCNGGTYAVDSLLVQPKFIFTHTENPEHVLAFDTGIAGFAPIELSLEESGWVSDVDPELGAISPYCTHFHPGLFDAAPPANCDCNENGLRDQCDIEEDVSLDCNVNLVPDECEIAAGEPDCNDNGVLDSCECPGDVQSDCTVDLGDIVALLNDWGECEGCRGDIDGSGVVDVGDIVLVLAGWGPCGE